MLTCVSRSPCPSPFHHLCIPLSMPLPFSSPFSLSPPPLSTHRHTVEGFRIWNGWYGFGGGKEGAAVPERIKTTKITTRLSYYCSSNQWLLWIGHQGRSRWHTHTDGQRGEPRTSRDECSHGPKCGCPKIGTVNRGICWHSDEDATT